MDLAREEVPMPRWLQRIACTLTSHGIPERVPLGQAGAWCGFRCTLCKAPSDGWGHVDTARKMLLTRLGRPQ